MDSVFESLGAVVALIEHADIKMPPSSEISAVMQNFERECLRWNPCSQRSRHFRVSVRQAMAHCFGPPASEAFDPAAPEKPAHPFDRYWWDIGTMYLEHTRNCLGAWLADERRNRQMRDLPRSIAGGATKTALPELATLKGRQIAPMKTESKLVRDVTTRHGPTPIGDS